MTTLKKDLAETTATLHGKRTFRVLPVEWDEERGIETDFVPASGDRPAQHRIFIEHPHGLVPFLFTRFIHVYASPDNNAALIDRVTEDAQNEKRLEGQAGRVWLRYLGLLQDATYGEPYPTDLAEYAISIGILPGNLCDTCGEDVLDTEACPNLTQTCIECCGEDH